jgi:ADP-dependent NAD(P)H-hydrate dehydratase / NAD(P)H-hydrate epimerase
MKIFTSEQVRTIDAFTIENEPIASIDLMERASVQITSWLCDVFEQDTRFSFFIGPGNNGGDGLAVARMLAIRNYAVDVYILKISGKLSLDAQINLERLRKSGMVKITEIAGEKDLQTPGADFVIIDAIFGSGLKRKIEGLASGVIQKLNILPNLRISIDIPSGLFGESMKEVDRECIFRADFTLALHAPSLSFFFSENQDFTGDWDVLPIGLHPEIMEELPSSYYYLTQSFIAGLLKSRKKFSHKGTYGHALLIAGCYGMMGAAVLASRACLRAGIGLVTTHVPRFGYSIIQTSVPESLVSIDESDIIFSCYPDLQGFTAVGVGPALGCRTNTGKAMLRLIEDVKVPLLIDADGLNLLAENPEWLTKLPENTILTPHPGEFDRLAGLSNNGSTRNALQIEFSKKYKVIIVLKGAHTSITLPDGTCYFNTTGNPGMATAGSGDVLSGIVLSLLGQGYTPGDAALAGVYLHGLAGDQAAEAGSEESLIAGDLVDFIGEAYRFIKGY